MLNDKATIASPQTKALIRVIQESFRVHPNQDPLYVDVGSHLESIALAQHQVIFGRRGSGKSCLLVHYHRHAAADSNTHSIYISADELKRLRYPDLLITLLLEIFRKLPDSSRPWYKRVLRRPKSPVEEQMAFLRGLLKEADTSDIEERDSLIRGSTGELGAGAGYVRAGAQASRQEMSERQRRFTEVKLDHLERSLQDFKSALEWALRRLGRDHAALLVDDFYLFPREEQPDVIDYLHRLVRGTGMYLKVATVRHRSSLLRRDRQTVGVELYQDVQEINLDRTLEELDAAEHFLMGILGRMAEKVGIDDVSVLFNPEGSRSLALASGGVPRDFLNIFVEAVNEAARVRSKWLTPTAVYKGAARILYRTKLPGLRTDSGSDAEELERVFQDVMAFCLREKRKTAFLIAQDEATTMVDEHAVIQQLMDFKLVHIIEPDTSAASGRTGRFEAYTLDFALFMEPRRRGIEHVEFWKFDEGRRRQGVREAPWYSLERASRALNPNRSELLTTEEVLRELEDL